MRIRKGFWIILSIIIMSSFCACGDDDDKEKEETPISIVGAWHLLYSKGYQKENGKITEEWDGANTDENEWVIKANRTLTYWEDGTQYMADYVYKDNKLYVGDEEEGEVIVFNVLKLTTEDLILELKMKAGIYEIYDKSTFRKVR